MIVYHDLIADSFPSIIKCRSNDILRMMRLADFSTMTAHFADSVANPSTDTRGQSSATATQSHSHTITLSTLPEAMQYYVYQTYVARWLVPQLELRMTANLRNVYDNIEIPTQLLLTKIQLIGLGVFSFYHKFTHFSNF